NMYNKAYRAIVVQKATGPNAPTLEALAKEFDASLASIYRWVKAAAAVELKPDVPDVESICLPKPIKMKRPQDWNPEEKLVAVLEAASLTDAELGAFLRNKGLHESHLQQWRKQMLAGLKPIPVQNKNLSALQEGDTLIVWRIDRLGLSLKHPVDFHIKIGETSAYQSSTPHSGIHNYFYQNEMH
ncbi:MAG: hypothetical protein QNK24_06120, partial [Desulfuromusa sp.]|nr:hypothetical protein [Desulfuromusa sp.]